MSAHRRLLGLLLAAPMVIGGACQRAPRAVPTYSEQVAPILERRCLPCHGTTPGAASVSPALTTAEQAQRVAAQLALAVERRRMPPWGADGTGLCGRFVDAAWLDDREILTLRAWALGGAPAGPLLPEAARAPAAGLQSPLAWLLDPAPGERRLSLATHFSPGLGSDATRCFKSDVSLDGDWSIGVVSVHADPPLSVQQMLLYALTDPGQLAAVQRLDAEDDQPGWSCYGSDRVEGSQLVASWSWVNPLQRLPAGSAVRASTPLPFVLQLRYNLIGTGLEPRAVHASAEVVVHPLKRAAHLWPVWVPDLRLAPGQRRVEAQHEVALTEPLQLLGIVPHLHGLGRSLVLERERAGQRSCLASFAHWNPAQEQLFRYRAPFDLAAGDRIRLRCAFDTSGRTEAVLGGENIDQEECRAYLYVSAAPEPAVMR